MKSLHLATRGSGVHHPTTMASDTYHEPYETLRPKTRDLHRAILSLMEELEAVDWYQQRIDATGDAELRSILEHNRDEEKEHAAMVLEWIRRHDRVFSQTLKTYLNTRGPIVEIEERTEAEGKDEDAAREAANGAG